MLRLSVVVVALMAALPAVAQEDLDLPVLPPEYSPEPRPSAPYQVMRPGAEEDGEDPRDLPEDPPVIFYGEEIPSEGGSVYYVLDASCSMDWGEAAYVTEDGEAAKGSRWDRAMVEVRSSIGSLSPNLRFGLLLYSCSLTAWGGGYQLADATDSNKDGCFSWLEQQEPSGGTGTGPAVAAALRGVEGISSVVLLTDGSPNCGVSPFGPESTPEKHRSMILKANTGGAAVYVFGISATGIQREFCQQVAADSGGTYTDVP